jgi:Mitochondrial carrier protein
MGGAPDVDNKDATYYAKCMIGGALACGLTHFLVTPLDLIKCRRQVDATLYKSVGDAFTKIKATEGLSGLMTVSFVNIISAVIFTKILVNLG